MHLSAELSLYPLDANYEKIVLAFIDTLLEDAAVTSVTNSMSTQIHGDAAAVFNVIERALSVSYERFGKQVLVAKFIPEHQAWVSPETAAE